MKFWTLHRRLLHQLDTMARSLYRLRWRIEGAFSRLKDSGGSPALQDFAQHQIAYHYLSSFARKSGADVRPRF